MKIYDFDKETDRRGSGAFKTDAVCRYCQALRDAYRKGLCYSYNVP